MLLRYIVIGLGLILAVNNLNQGNYTLAGAQTLVVIIYLLGTNYSKLKKH